MNRSRSRYNDIRNQTHQLSQSNTIFTTEDQLSRLYNSLDDIRTNISRINERNSEHGYLTYDDRVLLDTFTNMYNITNRQIDGIYMLIQNRDNENRTNTENINPQTRTRYGRVTSVSGNRGILNDVTLHPNITTRHTYTRPRNGGYGWATTTSDLTRNLLSQALHSFNEPVIISPTQQQIENATEMMVFSSVPLPTNASCPISLDRFEDNDEVMVIRHCGHCFQPQSLQQWFTSNVRCPVCRYDIRTYVVPTTQSNNNTTNTHTHVDYVDETEYSVYTDDEEEEEKENEDDYYDMPSLESTVNANANVNESIQNTNINTNDIFNQLANQALSSLFNIEQVGNVTYDPSSQVLVFDAVIQGTRR